MSGAPAPPLKGIKVTSLAPLIAQGLLACSANQHRGDQDRSTRRTARRANGARCTRLRRCGGTCRRATKKSVTVNMHMPEGQQSVRKLCAEAEYHREFPAGGVREMEPRVADDLAKINPQLVMGLGLQGMGRPAPYRDRSGLRRNRQIDGRHALRDPGGGPAAGAPGHFDRPFK